MLCVDTPRRAATSATGRPCSATCLTAATLNSSVNQALLINVSLRRYYEAKMCLVNLGRFRTRYYDEAVVTALITLWEASDRLCGKRLKALIPILIDAMQRHGHCNLDSLVEKKLREISAATIDRALAPMRQKINGSGRRRNRSSSVIRRAVPVRTFTDWGNPLPGYFEVDMVEHCGGPKKSGNFVHSLVLTDIASGWTECIALPARNHAYVIKGIMNCPGFCRGWLVKVKQLLLYYFRAHHSTFFQPRPVAYNQ